LGDVVGLDGITEHDSHARGFRRVTANLASVFRVTVGERLRVSDSAAEEAYGTASGSATP
jgi:hypothetical protein